jgi:enamine deaminase RidA (YjgF/YER057c/UK114 family)
MNFDELPYTEQIVLIKQRFNSLIEAIFNDPLSIYRYVEVGSISKQQAKQIRNSLNIFNHYTCLCCRKFDKTKIATPIEEVFEPLIDITKQQLKHQ